MDRRAFFKMTGIATAAAALGVKFPKVKPQGKPWKPEGIKPGSSPVLVIGGLSFKSIGVGPHGQSYAMTNDGDIYAWGAKPK